MSEGLTARFDKALKGRPCTVERREHDWTFGFGDGRSIAVSTPWRIVELTGIAFADTDHGQMFGLPARIDGPAKSNALLHGLVVEVVEVDEATADLRVRFTTGTRLEVFNNSSGYEGWQAEFPFAGAAATIIGLGGGGLAMFHR